jgi:hypothetical protein
MLKYVPNCYIFFNFFDWNIFLGNLTLWAWFDDQLVNGYALKYFELEWAILNLFFP